MPAGLPMLALMAGLLAPPLGSLCSGCRIMLRAAGMAMMRFASARTMLLRCRRGVAVAGRPLVFLWQRDTDQPFDIAQVAMFIGAGAK